MMTLAKSKNKHSQNKFLTKVSHFYTSTTAKFRLKWKAFTNKFMSKRWYRFTTNRLFLIGLTALIAYSSGFYHVTKVITGVEHNISDLYALQERLETNYHTLQDDYKKLELEQNELLNAIDQQAKTKKTLEDEIEKLEEKAKEFDSISEEYDKKQKELTELNQSISSKQKELDTINGSIASKQNELDSLNKQVSNSTRNSTGNKVDGNGHAGSATASEYFKNCTELTKKYPNGVVASHPAYTSRMDRDKDGWACER